MGEAPREERKKVRTYLYNSNPFKVDLDKFFRISWFMQSKFIISEMKQLDLIFRSNFKRKKIKFLNGKIIKIREGILSHTFFQTVVCEKISLSYPICVKPVMNCLYLVESALSSSFSILA